MDDATNQKAEPCAHPTSVCADKPHTEHWRPQAINALWAAVLIACTIVILKEHHLLDRVKIITLNAISSTFSLYPMHFEPLKRQVYLLHIGQQAYEDVFDQSSPLNRKVLAEFINTLSDEHNQPAMVAIDLDLSPNPSNTDDPNNQLRNAIIALASKGSQIILIFPEPVLKDEGNPGTGLEVKKQWMLELLQHKNIHFGLPAIQSIDGMVLKYYRSEAFFAGMMAKLQGKEFDHRKDTTPTQRLFLTGYKNEVDSHSGNDPVDRESVIAALLSRQWVEHATTIEQSFLRKLLAPIDYGFASLPEESNIQLTDRDKTLVCNNSSCTPSNLEGSVVMIGGDYGTTDTYQTPVGRRSGMELHFAAYYSMMSDRITEDSGIGAFLFEVAFGALLGYFLHKVLHSDWIQQHFLLRLGVVAAVVCYGVFLGLLSFILLRWLGLWINPAPLVVGIVIHELIQFIKGKGTPAKEHEGLLSTPQIVWQRLKRSLTPPVPVKSWKEKTYLWTDYLSRNFLITSVTAYASLLLIKHTLGYH